MQAGNCPPKRGRSSLRCPNQLDGEPQSRPPTVATGARDSSEGARARLPSALGSRVGPGPPDERVARSGRSPEQLEAVTSVGDRGPLPLNEGRVR